MKMMKILYLSLCVLFVLSDHGSAQVGHSFALVGLESHTVPVTMNKMTNLVFPVAIRAGVRVSRDVAVQKVKGLENVLEIKALRKDFPPTNLSVYGVDGLLYSFDLQYSDSATSLSFAVVNTRDRGLTNVIPSSSLVLLTGLATDMVSLKQDADSMARIAGFLHHSVRNEKMRLRIKGIYLRDSLLWLVVSLTNGSLIPYRPEYFQLSLSDRKRGKRMAIQRVVIEPVFRRLPDEVKDKAAFAIGYSPFTVPKRKKLVLEMGETEGGRLLELEVKGKMLLRAKR